MWWMPDILARLGCFGDPRRGAQIERSAVPSTSVEAGQPLSAADGTAFRLLLARAVGLTVLRLLYTLAWWGGLPVGRATVLLLTVTKVGSAVWIARVDAARNPWFTQRRPAVVRYLTIVLLPPAYLVLRELTAGSPSRRPWVFAVVWAVTATISTLLAITTTLFFVLWLPALRLWAS